LNKRRISNWSVMVGAVVLASVLWLHAVTEKQYRRTIEIPLVVVDPPTAAAGAEMMVANRPPEQVSVSVSGSGKDLLLLGGEELVLRVQAPSGRPGTRLTYRLSPEQVEVLTEARVRVEAIVDPQEVPLLLDWKGEKSVPVLALLALDIADSYTQVGSARVSPRTVSINGPRRDLERISHIETDSLVLSDLAQDVQRQVGLRVPPETRVELSHTEVTLEIDIQEVAESAIPNVPVSIQGAGGHELSLEPSRVTVRVRGGADVIYDLDPEVDLELYVDGDQWRRSGQGVGAVVARPESLFEIREITPATVNVGPR
jgi:YbbR domain-containing protein